METDKIDELVLAALVHMDESLRSIASHVRLIALMLCLPIICIGFLCIGVALCAVIQG